MSDQPEEPEAEPETESPAQSPQVMGYDLSAFRKNPAFVLQLNEFLSSPAGMALQVAMSNESPAKTLGANVAGLRVNDIRAKAVAESQAGASDNLIGTIGGFEAALHSIFLTARQSYKKPKPKQSSKGGAHRIPPARAPQS